MNYYQYNILHCIAITVRTIVQAVKVISSRHTTELQIPSTTLDAEKKNRKIS